MIFQTLRWTLLIAFWRKYKSNVIYSIIVIITLVALQYLHADYLQYQQLTAEPNEQHIAISFAVKWLLILGLIGSVIWMWRQADGETADKGRKFVDKSFGKGVGKKTSVKSQTVDKGQDPFEKIRAKKKLRSKADFIVENKDD